MLNSKKTNPRRTWSQIRRWRRATGMDVGDRYPIGCKSLAHIAREARRRIKRVDNARRREVDRQHQKSLNVSSEISEKTERNIS